MLMLMVTVALTQLWCDFDKSSSLRNQTFNESSPVPDICFYPEVGQSCSRVHLSHVPPQHLLRPSGGASNPGAASQVSS